MQPGLCQEKINRFMLRGLWDCLCGYRNNSAVLACPFPCPHLFGVVVGHHDLLRVHEIILFLLRTGLHVGVSQRRRKGRGTLMGPVNIKKNQDLATQIKKIKDYWVITSFICIQQDKCLICLKNLLQ